MKLTEYSVGRNDVILVTGSGRSGTSLCMYFLEQIGARMSPEMTLPSPQNPEGGQEDTEVLGIQQSLLRSLHTNTYLPMPTRWQKDTATEKAISQLRTLVKTRVEEDPKRPWAVKDPNLSLLLPLWTRVFNGLKLLPVPIICVRHPEAVARSMEAQYGTQPDMAFVMWILRNAYTLVHTGGDCVVLHYEDWERRPLLQLKRLANHVGLGSSLTESGLNALVERTFDKKLNRMGHFKKTEISNLLVRHLYEALVAVEGGEIAGREALLVAQECLEAVEQFRGMASVAHDALRQLANLKKEAATGKRVPEQRPKATIDGALVKELQLTVRELAAERIMREAAAKEVSKEHYEVDAMRRELEAAQQALVTAQSFADKMAAERELEHVQYLKVSAKVAEIEATQDTLHAENVRLSEMNESLRAHVRFLEGMLVEQHERSPKPSIPMAQTSPPNKVP